MNSGFNEGYIKIARQITDSAIWERPRHYLQLWLWLIVNANWKSLGVLERGEVIFSQNDLEAATAIRHGASHRYLTYGQIRDALNWLTAEGMIVTRKYKAKTIATIINYDQYQEEGEVVGGPAAVVAETPDAAPTTLAPANKRKAKRSGPDVNTPEWQTACTVLDLLNQLSGRSYHKLPGTLSNILARIREIDPSTHKRVYSFDDFDAVLRWKIQDEKFMQEGGRNYNPTTLFRPELFPRYVEEARANKKKTVQRRVETQEEMIQRLTA
jgi:hypothetical protein